MDRKIINSERVCLPPKLMIKDSSEKNKASELDVLEKRLQQKTRQALALTKTSDPFAVGRDF